MHTANSSERIKKKIGGFFGRAGHAARARGPSRAPSARTPRPERAQPGVRRRLRVSECPPKHPPRARAACGLSAASQEARARPTAAGGKPFAKKKKTRGKRFRMSRAAHARFAATPLRSKTEEKALPWVGTQCAQAPQSPSSPALRGLCTLRRELYSTERKHTHSSPPPSGNSPTMGDAARPPLTRIAHSDRRPPHRFAARTTHAHACHWTYQQCDPVVVLGHRRKRVACSAQLVEALVLGRAHDAPVVVARAVVRVRRKERVGLVIG